jgi:hypothetical protein
VSVVRRESAEEGDIEVLTGGFSGGILVACGGEMA